MKLQEAKTAWVKVPSTEGEMQGVMKVCVSHPWVSNEKCAAKNRNSLERMTGSSFSYILQSLTTSCSLVEESLSPSSFLRNLYPWRLPSTVLSLSCLQTVWVNEALTLKVSCSLSQVRVSITDVSAASRLSRQRDHLNRRERSRTQRQKEQLSSWPASSLYISCHFFTARR